MHVLKLVLNVRHTRTNGSHQGKEKKNRQHFHSYKRTFLGQPFMICHPHHHLMHHGLVKASKKQKRTVNVIDGTRTQAWHVEMMLSEHETATAEQVRISSYFW